MIELAIISGDVEGVRKVGYADLPERDHQAAQVEFMDGTTLIFDWHVTLNPDLPEVSTPSQFYGR